MLAIFFAYLGKKENNFLEKKKKLYVFLNFFFTFLGRQGFALVPTYF